MTEVSCAERIRRAAAAGQTAWWLNAVFAGRVPGDTGADQLTGSVGFPDGNRETWLPAIGRLRRDGVTQVAVRLTEPGDPAGLPGPPPTTRAALAAGAALVTSPHCSALVPVTATTWQVLPGTPVPGDALGTLAEARSLMRTAMADVTAALPGLEPDDAALAQVALLREMADPLPAPGVDPRAVEVSGTALRVWWLTCIADDLCARQARSVPALVRELRPLARRAASVAFSC